MQQEEQDRGPGCVPDADKGPVAQLPAPPPPAHSLLQGPSIADSGLQCPVQCPVMQCSAQPVVQCPALSQPRSQQSLQSAVVAVTTDQV